MCTAGCEGTNAETLYVPVSCMVLSHKRGIRTCLPDVLEAVPSRAAAFEATFGAVMMDRYPI